MLTISKSQIVQAKTEARSTFNLAYCIFFPIPNDTCDRISAMTPTLKPRATIERKLDKRADRPNGKYTFFNL